MKGKKKIFAAVLTFCLMLTGVPAVAFGEETAAAGDIVILYSSDIHGGVDSNLGLAGLAAYANEKRAQGSAVELVDAGDAVSGTMLATASQCRACMNLITEFPDWWARCQRKRSINISAAILR